MFSFRFEKTVFWYYKISHCHNENLSKVTNVLLRKLKFIKFQLNFHFIDERLPFI